MPFRPARLIAGSMLSTGTYIANPKKLSSKYAPWAACTIPRKWFDMSSAQQDFRRFTSWLHHSDPQPAPNVLRFANLVLANFDDVASRAPQRNQRAAFLVEQARRFLSATPSTPPEAEAPAESPEWPWSRLVSFKLGPFRGFRTEEVWDLGRRIILLYGPNGSGKSSVCEGLEYALLGSVQEAENKRIQERAYLANLHAGRFDPPVLMGLDQRGRAVTVRPDPEKFRFSFVEKNRIDAFSRLAAHPTGSRVELIAALFGMDDFNSFVGRFNETVDPLLVLSATKQDTLARLRTTLGADHELVDGQAEAFSILTQEETTLANSYSPGTSYDGLRALFGTPEAPARLQALDEAINAVPPAPIGISRPGLVEQLIYAASSTEARSGTVARLQARSSQVSFKALYQAVSELQEDEGDRCPACDTPLDRTVIDPFIKASEGLATLRELGELEAERDEADQHVTDASRQLRLQVRAIASFLEQNNEQDSPAGRATAALLGSQAKDWWAPLRADPQEQSTLLGGATPDDVFGACDRIARQDTSATAALGERAQNIAERNRLNQFQLRAQIQDAKRQHHAESVAAALNRIDSFETTNAQLIADADQEALDIVRDAAIKAAYDSFLERLRAFRDELPGTLMAGLNELALDLYNGFNREDRPEDKLAALHLPLTGDERIDIAFCGNPQRRVDALHVLSEGHIRCLGLAILLAKCHSTRCPLIVFDDAINAIDHDHRSGIRQTIFESDHFTDTQLIVTCHSNEFIKDIQNHLRQEHRQDTRSYLLRHHLGDHSPRVTTNPPTQNYVARARAAREVLDERDALAQGRRALEMLTEKVWKWLSSHEQGLLTVQLAGVGAEVSLYGLCGAIRKRLADATLFDHPHKTVLLTAYGRLLGIPSTNLVWLYLNKGTHEEADRDDFDAEVVETVVSTLEEIDALNIRPGH